MKALIGLVLVVVLLAVVGWITFSPTDDRTSINIETEKIQRDTQEIVDNGRELIQGAEREMDEAVDDDADPALEDEQPDDEPVTTPPPPRPVEPDRGAERIE